MAISLVINLRSHGLIRNCRYPSITICPASVPVKVELCPAAIKATANNMGAILLPSKGCNNLCASCICATPVLPDVKNTLAARIKIAAFTKKAAFNAMVLSMILYLMACRIPFLSLLIFLVCTNAECK